MKVTQQLVFAAYYMAIDADDAWQDNLACAKVNRWGKGAHAVTGYEAKLQADQTRRDAVAMMRKQDPFFSA